MKQILQSLRSGRSELQDVPCPLGGNLEVLSRTSFSLISAGTERMLVDFGRANWLEKARKQPDKVRMVLEKARTDGLFPTLDAVRSKLDQPLAPGYCNVGVIEEIGRGVAGFSIGDRIACNGSHAEMVSVPHTLCARIPDAVGEEEATFTVLGAIGLQGIRLAAPTLGECVVVTGLGLIGLLSVQLLRAQGCRVMGVDPSPERREMAQRFGAEVVVDPGSADVVAAGMSFSRGRGVDAVLITAATASSEPVSQAARMSRKRGRLVLVGVTGLELSRADFYEKELTFQVSCSYGPGRYDPGYETGGQDYPVGFVRWTEQRNFEAVLDMMATGSLDVKPLISHRFSLDTAAEAYDLLSSGQPSLGILLEYEQDRTGDELRRSVVELREPEADRSDEKGCRVAFLGAGNYASRVLIPAFQSAGAELQTLVSARGVSSTHHGRKFGFAQASTDWREALHDSSVNTAVITTRHDMHARQVVAALNASKHIFCEKPLCLSLNELEDITTALQSESAESRLMMVGFNRRFSPHVQKMKALLETLDEPMSMVMTVNAGEIPSDHWTQDHEVGGGRILGEACHFVDLLRFLSGGSIVAADGMSLGQHPALSVREDKATILIRFENGSMGTIHYLANGHRSFPKERLEVFCAGRVLQLDNFRKLQGWGWKGFSGFKTWRQDKGQATCARLFVEAVRESGTAPIPVSEILEVSRVSIELAEQIGQS